MKRRTSSIPGAMRFIKPFVEAGKVEALDDYLTDDFKSHLGPSTLTGFQFDEKTYALTTDQSVACMFYNKEMFEKLNLEVPETFDDFPDSMPDLPRQRNHTVDRRRKGTVDDCHVSRSSGLKGCWKQRA